MVHGGSWQSRVCCIVSVVSVYACCMWMQFYYFKGFNEMC